LLGQPLNRLVCRIGLQGQPHPRLTHSILLFYFHAPAAAALRQELAAARAHEAADHVLTILIRLTKMIISQHVRHLIADLLLKGLHQLRLVRPADARTQLLSSPKNLQPNALGRGPSQTLPHGQLSARLYFPKAPGSWRVGAYFSGGALWYA
jgi:hypothetical protein